MINPDDLLDSHEVANLAGLASRGAVAVYLARYPDFPRPVVSKGRCLLWLRRDVEAWRPDRVPVSTEDRPLRQLVHLSSWVGRAALELAAGHVRWVRDSDALAGTASAVSARVLIEFLVGRSRPNKKDAHARDFVADWMPSAQVEEEADHWFFVLDKWIVHLSWERAASPPDPNEPWSTYVEALVRDLRRLLDAVEQPAVKRTLRPGIERAEEILAEESERTERRNQR